VKLFRHPATELAQYVRASRGGPGHELRDDESPSRDRVIRVPHQFSIELTKILGARDPRAQVPSHRWFELRSTGGDSVIDHAVDLLPVLLRAKRRRRGRLALMDAPAAPGVWHVHGVGDKSCTHLPVEVADGSPCGLEHPYALEERSSDEQLSDRAVDRFAAKMKQAVERGEADVGAVP